MKFGIKTGLAIVAGCAALFAIGSYLPALAFFKVTCIPLSIMLVSTRSKNRVLSPRFRLVGFAFAILLFYVGSYGPFSMLPALTQWDRDKPFTQFIVKVGSVVYAPIFSTVGLQQMAGVPRLSTEYEAEWYNYGLYILGHPNDFTHGIH